MLERLLPHPQHPNRWSEVSMKTTTVCNSIHQQQRTVLTLSTSGSWCTLQQKVDFIATVADVATHRAVHCLAVLRTSS